MSRWKGLTPRLTPLRTARHKKLSDLKCWLRDLQLMHYLDDMLEMGVRRVRDAPVTPEDLEGLMRRIEARKFLRASAKLKTPVTVSRTEGRAKSVSAQARRGALPRTKTRRERLCESDWVCNIFVANK